MIFFHFKILKANLRCGKCNTFMVNHALRLASLHHCSLVLCYHCSMTLDM